MSIKHEIEVSKMVRGDLRQRYEIYRDCAGDRDGNDITTGPKGQRKPLKTFDEWVRS